MENKIQLQILGISSGHTTTSYTLILEEMNGPRKLPIIIGAFEAQAIAIEIEKIEPVRPMTHDLFKSLASSFEIRVQEVVIYRLHEGVFYASIICNNGSKKEEVDARTSDAIALALRFKCPIYTYEPIMEEAGIILSELEGEPKETAEETAAPAKGKQSSKQHQDLTQYSKQELDTMLGEAIEVENYILAAKIRDEIKKREESEK